MARNREEEEESDSAGSSEEEEEEEAQRKTKITNDRPKKRSKTEDNVESSLARIPLELATNGTPSGVGNGKKQEPVIVLLDQASLETVKNKRGMYELLNCDDHRDLCKNKLRKDPNLFRPDILHQEMLALLDSPLNKAGLLRIYIATTKKVLIQVHPSIRIPRTYKRFAGLMVQLLHKMKIKAGNDSTTLLKVIKNPFSSHLPPGTRCFGFSCEGTLYSPIALAKSIMPVEPNTTPSEPPTCFVVGAMSTGHITIEDHPYIEKMISISSYPLSGAAAASRLMGGIEHHWGIV
ncbi:ribosome biogenesis protein [Nitzschia inconspicua]|uniref:Ribosome biogenesis protein n=1 Tax=Nitzschia inconspicua TaxID=303405 RepID=A0A9K3KH85_9STRA|nr:ribosome biogenesis protein [Nitzschia inconspicua]